MMKKRLIIYGAVLIILLLGAFLYYAFETYHSSSTKVKPISLKSKIRLIDSEKNEERSLKIYFALSGDPTNSKSPIYIGFSIPINKKIKKRTFVEKKIVNIKPSIKGSLYWEDSNRLVFYPKEKYKPNTTYKVSLVEDILPNKKIKGKKEFLFSTQPFKVIGLSVISRDYVNRTAKIEVSFNYPVNKEILKKHIAFLDNITGKSIKFEVSSNKDEVIYNILLSDVPSYIMKAKSRLLIKIDSGLTIKGTNIKLGKEYSTRIRIPVPEPFYLDKYKFSENNQKISLILKFTAEVNKTIFSSYFSMKPYLNYSVKKAGKYIFISADFKSGKEYTFKIKKGLKSVDSKELKNDEEFHLTVPDLSPQLQFLYKGTYLPKTEHPTIKIRSTNITGASLEIRKIYPNNLAFWYGKYFADNDNDTSKADKYISSIVYNGIISLSDKKNKTIITDLDLSKYIKKEDKGVFEIKIYSINDDYKSDYLWINLTNLGVVYKKGVNKLKIWAFGLKDLSPVSGVKISFLRLNNQITDSFFTDGDGVVEINDYDKIKSKGEIILLIAEKGDDFTYIDTNYSKIDVSDFDTGGDSYDPQSGYQAYVYSERELYRPGEKVNIAAIVRDKALNLPEKMTFNLKIFKPNGKLRIVEKGKPDLNGMLSWKIKFSDSDRTGTYPVKLFLGKRIIGETNIKLEEFVPERIKLIAKLNKKEFYTHDIPKVKLKANYLFGPPLTNGKYVITAFISPVITNFKGYEKYVFGQEVNDYKMFKINELSGKLNENGMKDLMLRIPSGKYAGKMKLTIDAEVFEGDSGKSVNDILTGIYSPYKVYIGLKRISGYLKENESIVIEGVVLSDKGELLKNKRTLNFKILKRDYGWVYYDDDDYNYHYKRVEYEELVDNGKIIVNNGKFTIPFTPEYGTYRINVSDLKNVSSTDIILSTYWWEEGSGEKRKREAERINIFIDRTSVRIGDEIKIGFVSPYDGKLILSVEGKELLYSKISDIKRGEQNISLKIRENMDFPNIYVSVLIIKKMTDRDPFPSRAYGTVPLKIIPEKNILKIDITTPKVLRPKHILPVKIKAIGESKAEVTIAAVDEGILQITDYKTPNPLEYFFRKRRLGISTFDVFGLLLPDFSKQVRNGAGYEEKTTDLKKGKKMSNLKRVKPVSLWSGIVKLDENGEGKVFFKIPNYQGQLRIMAVGVAGKKFGNCEKKVYIRDRYTIEATLPRFFIKGDKAIIPVDIFNNTKYTKSLELKTDFKNIILESELPDKIKIKGNNSKHFEIRIRIPNKSMNYSVFKFMVTDGKRKVYNKIDIPVKDIMDKEEETFDIKVEKGEHVIPVNINKWKEDTDLTFSMSYFKYIKELGHMSYLIHYPYGCIEQTVSSVFPIIYIKDILKIVNPKALKGKNIYRYVYAGINRVMSMQTVSGGFGFWPGSTSPVVWGSTYALHFLYEAKVNGYDVPNFVINNCVLYLQKNIINSSSAESFEYNRSAYIIYVLTKLKEYDKRELNSYYDNYYNKMSSEGKALLGASFINVGMRDKGLKILKENLGLDRESSDYGSVLRSYALRLYLNAEANSPERYKLSEKVAKFLGLGYDTYYYNTQEIVWSVLGFGTLLRKEKQEKLSVDFYVDGKLTRKFRKKNDSLLIKNYNGEKLKVVNHGATLFMAVKISGRKKNRFYKDISNGMTIKRKYYTMDGKPLKTVNNYYSTKLASLIIVKLTIKATGYENLYNLAIVDRIPAGFSIENPRIGMEHPVNWLDKPSFVPDYIDIRDDKLMIFGNLSYYKGKAFFYYVIRAVNKGEYLLPPVKGEMMYKPKIRCITDKKKIIIE